MSMYSSTRLRYYTIFGIVDVGKWNMNFLQLHYFMSWVSQQREMNNRDLVIYWEPRDIGQRSGRMELFKER